MYSCYSRPCPTGMVASNNSGAYPTSASWWADNGDGTRGFYSVKACVTQPGYGYNSRVAAPCPVGSFNQKDNYGSCTRCPVVGTTTAGVGAGVTAADCGVAAGYGSDSGSIAPCAVGQLLMLVVLVVVDGVGGGGQWWWWSDWDCGDAGMTDDPVV